MYHYIEDKAFRKKLRTTCSGIVNQLVQRINNGSVMKVQAHLVGSGAKNLITQNADRPVDLDYNLCIIKTTVENCRDIKEYVRKQFNAVLRANGWGDCQDSTSALTTEKRRFRHGNQTEFSIDLAIVCCFNNSWQRLIHYKTGVASTDLYTWNQVRDSGQLEKKAKTLKANQFWPELRNVYLDKKNTYLGRNDTEHPSFVAYIEAVNQVYRKYEIHSMFSHYEYKILSIR